MLSYESYQRIVLQLSPQALYKFKRNSKEWQNNPPDISDDLNLKLPSNDLACDTYMKLHFIKKFKSHL